MIVFDPEERTFLTSSKGSAFASEKEIDEFLFNNPELLSMALTGDGHRLIPLARQFFSTDLLFLQVADDDPPTLLIVEDKLGVNREVRRKVIAQLIDYMSRLETMSEDTFQEKLAMAISTPTTLAALKVCQDSSHFPDDEELQSLLSEPTQLLEQALTAKAARRFRGVICSDHIPESLKRMLAWFNRQVASGQRRDQLLEACELGKWDKGDRSVLALGIVRGFLDDRPPEDLEPAELERLHVFAASVARSSVFQTGAVEVAKQGETVVVEATSPNAAPRRPCSQRLVDRSAWLETVSPAIRALYHLLHAALPDVLWRSGGATGSQLVLELPHDGGRASLLRLKPTGFSFVGRPSLWVDLGLADWRGDQLELFPIKDRARPQPSVSLAGVENLVAEGAKNLIAYVKHVQAKLEEDAS